MSVFETKPWLKHYDFWVPPTATFPRQSLYVILQTAASQFRHRPATAFLGAQLTFEKLKDRADCLAASLHLHGIRKGDRIGIMLPNCPQYPIAFFAAMRLGAIVVNINPTYTPRELKLVAEDAGIRVLVTLTPSGLPLDLEILTTLSAYSADPEPHISNFDALIANGDPDTLPRVAIDAEEDIALLQYTGGTTGVSKAAMLTHYNLFANTVQNALWRQYLMRRGEERMLMVLPFFHIYGQVVGLLLSTWNGTMNILIPKFDVNAVIDAVRKHEPTVFPGVPTLFISLLNHPEAQTCGLHKVKHFNSGAAPLPVDVIVKFEQLSGAVLCEGYGMTETSCTASTTPLLAPRKIGSIGIPVTGTDFKIVDVEDPAKELGIGEEGELCVRGPQIMKGYWKQPEETAHALRDGWMLTGDIAKMDADGFFYIVQRKKDLIIVSGFKVFPNEVEDVLFTHPAVREACVVGQPHPYRGEQVNAFVVPKQGAAPTAEELIAYCAERLAKYKVPSEIAFLDALPKTAVGKVLRRQLRDTPQTNPERTGENEPMSDLIQLSKDGGAGVITVNNPPVNALSPGVPEGIAAALETHIADPAVNAIVLIGGGRTFIAGADIKEFGKVTGGQTKGHSLLPLMLAMEDSPKPVIVAIHGTALGGGLEVAMGGHYRVAVASAQAGQPEVKIGLIPGAAGTQRLPRLAGVALAAEMCAFGEPISAAKAHEAGIVDALIDGDLLAGALAFAREKAAEGGPYPKPRDRAIKPFDPALFDALRAQARRAKRNQTAPLAAIDAVEAATGLPFPEGCARERELFNDCLFGPQSKALIHAFFGEREVAKIPGIPKDTPVREIRNAAVIGAGTMGGGITMNFVNAGIPVRLRETTQEALDRGMATIRKNYANSVAKGRFSREVMDRRLALITPQLTYEGFEEADIVTEAVFEGMALKKEIFAEIDRIAKPGCILASNTSTLSIDEIASATTRPQDVIGTHYFSPANVMRLLELVRGAATGIDVIATCMALAKRLNKVGVLVGNCRGFVGNRMIHCYLREAQFLVEEGAAPEQVDAALYDWGMAMGPLAMGDLAGLDVGWRIRKEFKHLEKPGVRIPHIADQLCELGRYGQKTGAGWYKYDDRRQPSPDPAVSEIIANVALWHGIERREVSKEEILDRTLLALVNEGARILEEGIALRPVDIDVIYLTGYGFPAYRGGPMFYADSLGLANVLTKIEAFQAQHGELWEPAPLLVKLAKEGKTFSQWANPPTGGA